MNKKQVNIDSLTINLPQGWQGDYVYLARKISEQLQLEAGLLQSTDKLDIHLQGNFAGQANRVNRQLSDRLQQVEQAQQRDGKDR